MYLLCFILLFQDYFKEKQIYFLKKILKSLGNPLENPLVNIFTLIYNPFYINLYNLK